MDIMRRAVQSFVFTLTLAAICHGQTSEPKTGGVDIAARETELLADLKALAAEAQKLEKPLARAAADAEIADAAWSLDREWSRTLLLEAFRRTLPAERERAAAPRPVGAAPRLRSSAERARDEIRARIFQIAGRDKSFAEQFRRDGVGPLDPQEENMIYSELAHRALAGGDRAAAIEYSLKTFDIDPTQGSATGVINDLALQDRAAADRLILKYIESLRPLPLSVKNGSLWRVSFTLNQLVFPNAIFFGPVRNIPPPGAEVPRAYVGYVLEAIARLAQTEPDGLRAARTFLLSAWLPLRQHAPELMPAFVELERITRTPGLSADLPTQSYEERDKELYERRDKDALKSERPDARSINSLINRGEFDTARKLIDKLPDGGEKEQLTEKLNASEAVSRTAKGDVAGATRLAERLTGAVSINRVYPAIIGKCAATKDQPCVTSLVYSAVKQLKASRRTPPAPPAGTPPSASPAEEEFDPVLAGLGQLAKSVAPLDAALAAEVLDEMVQAANRSRVDTEQGRLGFEAGVFRALARRDEFRARQSAEGLKDRLRRVTALAEIYQWRATELREQPVPISKIDKQGNPE
jgi:hypothetical protein